MVDIIVIACVAAAIYVMQAGLSLYRENQHIKHRDELIKAHRMRETELLNRLMATSIQEYAMLNRQAAEIETETFTRPIVDEDKIQDYLEQAGLGSGGYSPSGVAVV